MFNEGFFPTPVQVIIDMISPVRDRLHKSTILEPSAGKGDILDYITRYQHVNKKNTYAIEIEPELQLILVGKDYPIIGDDFLKFNEPYKVDLILMNPPFAAGAEHVLKAWNVVAEGGAVVALVNSETLKSLHTKQRQLLSGVILKHGTVKELGQVFKSAERKTDVNVSLIVLEKPSREFEDTFSNLNLDEDSPVSEVEFSASPLAERDLIKSLVAQYDAAVRALRDKALADAKVQFFTKSVVDLRRQAQLDGGATYAYVDAWEPMKLNDEIQKLKDMFWNYIFDKTQLANVTTTKVRDEFRERQQRQRNMSFTVENVYSVLEILFFNAEETIKQCVVDAFDTATKFHEKNSIHVEGWKTNKSWKIAPKIIIPAFDSIWRSQYYAFFNDMDKAMCFISGKKFTDIKQTLKVIEDTRRDNTTDWGDKFESEYFEIKMFKKGTVHMKFKDKDLHAKFNQTAAEGKNWVGGGY